MKKKIRILSTVFMIMMLAASFVMTAAGEPSEEIAFSEEPQLSDTQGQPEEAQEDAQEDAEEIPQHLTVASTTHLSGNFFADLFGRNTSDLDVQALLQGCNLVTWNESEGMFVTDPSVVSGISVMENEEGDRTYLLNLYDDLYFSDGTRITAWDYAFTWLLLCSEEIGGLGVTPMDLSWIAGFPEYKDGELPYLTGLRVLTDDSMMVIVKHDALPFFYEMGLLSCVPFPIRQIAPGVRVFDDGYGVYLANDPDWEEPEESEEESEEQEPGEAEAELAEAETEAELPGTAAEPQNPLDEEPRFTTQLLAETILDPETGYLSHPSVVSGPYVLTSWDGETAEFERNIYYKGYDPERSLVLETLTYHCLANEDMMDELENGDTGLLNKVTDSETIQDGLERVADRKISYSNYARTGQTFISFSRIRETSACASVRKAIAWCMNRDEVMEDYTGNFGLRTDGYYGIGQWMYRLAIRNLEPPRKNNPEAEDDAAAQAADEAEQAAWEKVNLDNLTEYNLNLEYARTLLEEDGWTLNEDGIRERNGVVLDLTMAYPAGNRMQKTFEELLIPNLEKVGIHMTLLPLPMEKLLELYYEQLETGDDDEEEAEESETDSLPEIAAEEETEPEAAAEAETEQEAAASEDVDWEHVRPEDVDMFYLGSNFDVLFEPEGLFAEYAPRQTELSSAAISGGYVFLDRSKLKGTRSAEAASLLEQELSLAASHTESNANAYVKAWLEPQELQDPAAAETEEVVSETEQIIRELTEAAMVRIYAPEEEDPEESDNAEEPDPEMLRLQMINSYIDIYNNFIELYRDYGSIYVQAMDMRETKPGEVLEYMQKWVLFQELINEHLPMIPIYSNVYFDFYTADLKGYAIADNITWGNAIVSAYLQESETQPAEGEAGSGGDEAVENETDSSAEESSEPAQEDGLFDLGD